MLRIARLFVATLVVSSCFAASVARLAAAEPPSAAPMAAPSAAIRIWPGLPPGETVDLGPEKEIVRQEKVKATRITNIGSPTITVFRPPADRNTGTAVIVCPGGGYGYVVVDKEGTEVCQWLNSLGVTGVLLKYRTPVRKDRPRHLPPLQDAQRAVRLVRQRAAEWGVNPERIGIAGFSAGGHLAACASTSFETPSYEPIGDLDRTSCRPDFAMLLYPAYLTIKAEGEKLVPETPVSAKTPPTFLMMTQDDGVRVESALFYYLALKNARVPAELHLYATGGHGYGMRLENHNAATWPDRAADWLRGRGLLAR